MLSPRLALSALLAAGLVACATSRPHLELAAATSSDDAALNQAVERYYQAGTPAEMRAAVEQAKALAPASARYHEIAAHLAFLEDRPSARFDHLVAALQDASDDAALYHLHLLMDLPPDAEQRVRYEGLLEALSTRHPDPQLRAVAAHGLAIACRLRADERCEQRANATAGTGLPLAVIGAFDSDQGKGFDIAYPPEDRIELGEKYDGAVVPVRWRVNPPRDSRGQLPLAESFTPARWAVAYGLSAVQAPEAGTYELRVASTDGLKVWLNGQQVFEQRLVSAYLYDQFVIPLTLRKGANRVLIKSAHADGNWALFARMTKPGGLPAPELSSLAPDTAFAKAAPGTPAPKPLTGGALLEERLARLPAGSTRRQFHQTEWARLTLGGSETVAAAQRLSTQSDQPGAVYLLAGSLWSNGERDKTADLLSGLASGPGKELPFLAVAQARFWRQQGLRQKAREALTALTRKHDDRPSAWRELAELFEGEGWTEDRCNVLEALDQRHPRWTTVQLDLASCLDSLRFRERAQALYLGALKEQPNQPEALRRLADQALVEGDLASAKKRLTTLVQAYPTWPLAWLRLSEVHRRAGDRAASEAALGQLLALNPDSVEAFTGLASLAYQAGDKVRAIQQWQAALDRNPDDEKLANRVAYLAPMEGGAWTKEVPTEKDLDAAVAARSKVTAMPGANVAYLLDHEVTELKSDGSTVNVVTLVAHAFNQEGRDKVTVQRLGHGRTRILHAYAVDPNGRRAEASSIRGREVRFRGLQVGSTVVLQYRQDVAPQGYLSKHLARAFWFQGAGEQHEYSRWVLFAPKGVKLNVSSVGDVKREDSTIGDEMRVAWTARNVPPVIPEPEMPTSNETNAHVAISTVPNWDVFLKWEEALLQDAFRSSPELDALAKRLFEGADTKWEKVLRLHTFLMEDIRYQQDYENFIAGVKPHAAPVVVERGYGDCKDKAVLFITLARKAGIEVMFADVRTRGKGPVREEVPMQQFDHAIVYVPAQDGIPEGRFFDPTADALDVESLREDDTGTRALVLDPVHNKHFWRDIPFQTADRNRTDIDVALQLAADGSATGTMEVTATGSAGSALRRSSRNSEIFRKVLQSVASNLFTGATVTSSELVEVKDLRKPAKVKLAFSVPNAARKEGESLRLKIPTDWSPKRRFALPERKYPLLLGAPQLGTWKLSMQLPPGMTATHLPTSEQVTTPCLSFGRTVTPGAQVLNVSQQVSTSCERISAEDYASYRKKSERMLQLLDEEVVVSAQPLPKVRTSKRARGVGGAGPVSATVAAP